MTIHTLQDMNPNIAIEPQSTQRTQRRTREFQGFPNHLAEQFGTFLSLIRV